MGYPYRSRFPGVQVGNVMFQDMNEDERLLAINKKLIADEPVPAEWIKWLINADLWGLRWNEP